jgi:hypothetical protein
MKRWMQWLSFLICFYGWIYNSVIGHERSVLCMIGALIILAIINQPTNQD